MAYARFRACIFSKHPAILGSVDAVKPITTIAQQLDVWRFRGTVLLPTPFGNASDTTPGEPDTILHEPCAGTQDHTDREHPGYGDNEASADAMLCDTTTNALSRRPTVFRASSREAVDRPPRTPFVRCRGGGACCGMRKPLQHPPGYADTLHSRLYRLRGMGVAKYIPEYMGSRGNGTHRNPEMLASLLTAQTSRDAVIPSAEAIERLMATQNAEGAASRICATDHGYLRYTQSAS